MGRVIIDLRKKGKGCTGDPVYRLSEALNKVREDVEVLADPTTLPMEVVSLVAKIRGFVIVSHEETDGYLRILLSPK